MKLDLSGLSPLTRRLIQLATIKVLKRELKELNLRLSYLSPDDPNRPSMKADATYAADMLAMIRRTLREERKAAVKAGTAWFRLQSTSRAKAAALKHDPVQGEDRVGED